MNSGGSTKFKRRIGSERILLMLPLNIVMVGRIRGTLERSRITEAMEKLRSRHPFLGVRVQIDDDGTGSYIAEDVPAIVIHVEPRQCEEQWIARVKEEFRTPFPIETGPLVRCSLVQSEEVSELILCGHHAICDGMSLGYLLRDILKYLAEPIEEFESSIYPPPIDHTTVSSAPSTNPILRFIMDRINNKWAAKNIRFSESEMCRMHEEFWKRNPSIQVLAWDMDPWSTAGLVERCRAENVTVNSALWTAFLAAQYDVQDDRRRYRQRSALAVSTRDKLSVSVGEAFGFYASSLTVKLPYSRRKSFWDNARKVHSRITKELSKTNLFRMFVSEMIHPTLLDSLYFRKYGLLDETMPKRLLSKMDWHEITYGYALTNVGRFDIPTTYGPYRLEAVYGPLFYSDVEEKMVGVITVGGRLSIILASNESVVGDSTRLKKAAMGYLETGLQQHC